MTVLSWRPARANLPAATLTACRLVTALVLAGAGVSALAADAVPYQVFNNPRRQTATVFEDPHYNHAATVAQWGDRLYVAWNGNRYNASESQAGQVIMLSTSEDGGAHWSAPILPFVKEYRAFDDQQKKGVDAAPGNADDDHKVRYTGARQWQPSLTVFKGRLLMFWGVDRFAEGAAMLMSSPEGNGKQWRTNELHFKPDGTPYFVPEVGGKAPATDDAPSLAIESASRYTRIPGASAMPQSVRLRDVPGNLLKAESLNPARSVGPGDVPLSGHRLVPSPNQATVLRMKDGSEVLAVALVLHQTVVGWDVALKVPAVLTTTDLEHWQLSVLPMRGGQGDLLPSDRGDIGLVSAWEPTVTVDRQGDFRMEFRLNLPPVTSSGGNPAGTGFRTASASGTWEPGVGVHWQAPHLVDYDVPATRSMMTRIPGQQRWVMVANHAVQGVSYDGTRPAFKAERYDPWARANLTMFFSTRGDDDFIAGVNISGRIGELGREMVHYPYVQAAAIGGTKGDDLLIAYSTHRREPQCAKGGGSAQACHDSIQFVRVADMPDPKRPAIYPNHFAATFAYGRQKPQEGTYNWDEKARVLTLHDRGSAGIETPGRRGCVNLRFRMDGRLQGDDLRPILAFGRTANRAVPVGLVARGAPGGGTKLVLGDKPINANPGRDGWTDTRVCYDFGKGRLSAGGVDYEVGAGRLSQQSYLGDDTLARRDGPLPDLQVDLSATSLERGEEE